jgi:hypothetical protein
MIGWLRERIQPKRDLPDRAAVLSARPVRNPTVEWERLAAVDGRPAVVQVRVPRRRDRWGNWIARWFRLPEFRRIELDEIGSDLWEACDGQKSVGAITQLICDRYRLNRRQAETSVTAYLRMLAQRRLIGVRTPGSAGKVGKEKGKR